MAGTKEGAQKRRETMIKKAGGLKKYMAQQRKIAAKGGAKAAGHFKKDRKLAALAGRKSKRNKAHDEISFADKKFKMGQDIANDIKTVDADRRRRGLKP